MTGRPKMFKDDDLVSHSVYIGKKQKEYLRNNHINISAFLRWCINQQQNGKIKYEEEQNEKDT